MLTPRFQITNTILKNIGIVEACKEVIENSPIVPTFEKQFQSEAFTKTIHHATHIEGNDLSLIETRKILEGESVVAKTRDVQEIINYRKVVELIQELSFKRGNYEPEMLTDLHQLCVEKLISEDKVGVFRKTQVIIKNESTGEVILRPPSFETIPVMISDFFEWLNSENAREAHPVLRAGVAHYVLVAIHPFVEGNGRTIRAFASLILLREGYDLKKFSSLEEHFDSDLESYYSAFAEVDKLSPEIRDRDLTPWLEYFTNVVAIELSKIKEKIRRISIDTRLKVKIGQQIALSERQMKLVEYLTDQGEAGMKELKSLLKLVSEDTILRDLKDLMDKGLIKKQGSTKASKYVIKRAN